jgi:predicted nucleic acid-binding protein
LGAGAANAVLAACLRRQYQALMGTSLLAEHEAVMGRQALFVSCRLSPSEREELLDIYLGVCEWTRVYYTWRPNVQDESDNHVLELAIAGGADFLVSRNHKDFRAMELRFPQLRLVTPESFLKEL